MLGGLAAGLEPGCSLTRAGFAHQFGGHAASEQRKSNFAGPHYQQGNGGKQVEYGRLTVHTACAE